VDVVWMALGPGDKRGAAAVRHVLGRYLGADPASLAFAMDERGKPRLDRRDPLRFNLSHSGGGALCALSLDLEVGVDLEIRQRRVDERRVAERVLGKEIADRLATLDTETREREFLIAWVRHEAVQKCLGAGIFAPPEAADSAEPWAMAWELGPRAAAALACDREPGEVRRWTWPRR
jgi:4'-phosphopantetheinyl transferase